MPILDAVLPKQASPVGRPLHAQLRRRPHVALLAAAAALFQLAGPGPSIAASRRLSHGQPFSDVCCAELTPDGLRVVYRDDAEVDELRELWSVAVASGVPVRLSRLAVPLGTPALALDFAISPDSQTVVYRAAQDDPTVLELYRIPTAGPSGSEVKLSRHMVEDGDVLALAISPDGGRVVYVADAETDGARELYSVPIGGGATVKLNSTLRPGGNVDSFGFSPGGSRVVYRADQEADARFELYSVPTGGGTAVKLNGPLVPGGDVSTFAFAPDGSRVVYLADQQTNDSPELYSVPLGGGGVTPLSAGGEVRRFAVATAGGRVAYIADDDTVGVQELYSVGIGGGATIKLNPTLVTGGNVRALAIDPGGSRVVYKADQQTDGVFDLFTVPIAGGEALNLTQGLTPETFDPIISRDGSHVIYTAYEEADDRVELFSVPIAGGEVTQLTPAGLVGTDVPSFLDSADSRRVVYLADKETAGVFELFSVPIAGGEPQRLNGPLPPDGVISGVSRVLPSANGLEVVYQADEREGLRNELFVGDVCLLCDGFESGDASRWSDTFP
jgi:Tol biopolymer transport system component